MQLLEHLSLVVLVTDFWLLHLVRPVPLVVTTLVILLVQAVQPVRLDPLLYQGPQVVLVAPIIQPLLLHVIYVQVFLHPGKSRRFLKSLAKNSWFLAFSSLAGAELILGSCSPCTGGKFSFGGAAKCSPCTGAIGASCNAATGVAQTGW